MEAHKKRYRLLVEDKALCLRLETSVQSGEASDELGRFAMSSEAYMERRYAELREVEKSSVA